MFLFYVQSDAREVYISEVLWQADTVKLSEVISNVERIMSRGIAKVILVAKTDGKHEWNGQVCKLKFTTRFCTPFDIIQYMIVYL